MTRQAQTCDLLETLTTFFLYFLTTVTSKTTRVWLFRPMKWLLFDDTTPPSPPLTNSLSFHLLHACRQAPCVGVTGAVEALHLLPQSAELQAASCHLFLQQTALPLGHAHCFGVTGESRLLHRELHGLQPGLQAAEGLEHFNNLHRTQAQKLMMNMLCC